MKFLKIIIDDAQKDVAKHFFEKKTRYPLGKITP